MSNENENITGVKPPPKKKKSFFGRLAKWFSILIILLLFLILGIFLFIQTDTFDRIALGFALDKINEALAPKESKISAESLTGNILKGFTLNKGSVKVKDDTLLNFNSIQAEYSILKLLNKEIFVPSLILKEPQINLTKIKDKNDSLKWNFEYLLESEDKDEDTTTSEFDWKITAENLSIENGSVRILEEKNSDLPIRDIVMPKLDSFKFGKLDVSNLNLNLSAKYFPDSKQIDLKNLSFNTNSDFNLKQLSLTAVVNQKDTATSVKNLSVITDRSDFAINELVMKNFDPFHGESYEDFGNNSTKLNLEAKVFNFKDLTFFLPGINFLDSTVSLKLIAEGNYGNLNIDKLDLQTPNSTYSFSGNVKNLNRPSELYFNVTGNNIEIDPRDTKLILPGLPIPDYSHLGKVYIPYLTYKGEPERFSSDFDVRSSAGNANGNVYFDFTGSETRYKGDVSTSNLNIGRIVKDRSLESNINGEFIADARGFDYRTASGRLNYRLYNSKFYGQSITRSDGVLNFNRANVGLDLSYNSTAVKTKLAGKINISNLKNISYDLKGTVSGLNIAAFTKDNNQQSNLSFDFDVNGRGFDPNNMTGDYKISMKQSTFAGYNVPEMPLEVEIGNDGSIRNVSLKSQFVDLSANGSFDFNTLVSVFQSNIDKIQSELTLKAHTDTLSADEVISKAYITSCRNMNLEYSIDVKDLTPFRAFIGGDTVQFIGIIKGNISDSCGIFTMTANGDIKKLSYLDSVFLTRNAKLNFDITNDINGYQLTKMDAGFSFESDKLIVSKFPLDTTFVKINLKNNRNEFLIWSQIDSTAKLFTEGNLQDSLVINFDTLAAFYKKIEITNNNDLIVKYDIKDSSRAIEFRKFTLNGLRQKLDIEGKYSLTDSSDLKISSSNIDLATYQKLFSENPDTTSMVTGKIRYVDLKLKGTQEFPVIEFGATSDILKVGSTKIGRLDANIKYDDYELTPNIIFYNENNTGNFSLTGYLPIHLTFSDKEVDTVARNEILEKKEANLNAVAKNFQLKVFQQLLPYTENLQGILDGRINLTGTSLKPELTGNMNVNKGKVYVTLNKMNYDFNAKLTSQNEKLLINESKIFVADEPSRFISSVGYLDLTGFTLSDLYLEMSGNLRAFDKDNGMTELGISGDLWVGSGKPILKIKGSPGRIDLTGNLILVKGNVTFNPFIQEAYNIYSDDFRYGIILDSVRSDSVSVVKTIMQSPDSVLVVKRNDLNPFEKILYAQTHSDVKQVAAEKGGQFFYNVYITTDGNVFLKFIVNEKSQQEFFGEIRTELFVDNKENNKMAARGVVNLGQNCYYKFFRKFDATGKAIFTGPVTNPELDINAEYKGTTTTTSSRGVENIQDVYINMKVTGFAMNPVLTISLERDGVTETGSGASSDAISFLLFGKFSNQLSFSESSSFGASVGASILSNYVASSLENILPFLINTEVNYVDSQGGTVAENTDIRFTASLGDAIIRFGGQVFKGITNTDIALDYPLNKLFKVKSLSNNLILRVERYYDPLANQNDISNTSGKRTGAVIYYKLRF